MAHAFFFLLSEYLSLARRPHQSLLPPTPSDIPDKERSDKIIRKLQKITEQQKHQEACKKTRQARRTQIK